VGPELTAAGSKYSPRDLLESILDPSKVINEQYQNHTVLLKDGDSVTGRLVSQTPDQVVIETDRIYGTQEKFPTSKVLEVKPSNISPMPSGLVNVLTKEEILDLLSYVSRGFHE
jgi:putative heme-binding domain-containing protein